MPHTFQPVVIGYLDNPEGRAALDQALSEAELRGAQLIIVHSSTDSDGPTFEERPLAERFALHHIDYELRDVKAGRDVPEALVAVAEQTHADLIVIGLPRRNPVGKLFLGSHAQRILLTAECPVLAVKAR